MFELPPGTAALCIEVLSNVEFGPATVGNQPGMVRRKDDSYMHDVGIDDPHPAARAGPSHSVYCAGNSHKEVFRSAAFEVLNVHK